MAPSSTPTSPLPHASQNPVSTKPTLLTIPLELKHSIFKLLLWNPILGQIESISVGGGYGTRLKYGLSPAILRVCRQLYTEASTFLYGQNTFIIECVKDAEGDRAKYDTPAGAAARGHLLFNASPLTRRWNGQLPKEARWTMIPSIQSLPWIRKVRHWRLVLSSTIPVDRNGRGFPPAEVTKFCRAIHRSAPQSLQVIFVPAADYEINEKSVFKPIPLVLKPLQILRGVGKFDVAEASGSLLYTYSFVRYYTPYVPAPQYLDKGFVQALRNFVMVKGEVELPFLMYKVLLQYATSFERFLYFKYDMDIRYYTNFSDSICSDWKKDLNQNLPMINPPQVNPYKMFWHPVENGLEVAKIAAEDDSRDKEFKAARAQVLNYLEPQYQRISAASLRITDFVKDQKFDSGLFDPTPSNISQNFDRLPFDPRLFITEALELLQNYANSFTRDAPPDIQAVFISQKPRLDSYYGRLHREIALKKLGTLQESQDYTQIIQLFKIAVNDMDMQWLQIREARKMLFHFDHLNKRGCDIDPEIHRCDEKIDWTVSEPFKRFAPLPRQ